MKDDAGCKILMGDVSVKMSLITSTPKGKLSETFSYQKTFFLLKSFCVIFCFLHSNFQWMTFSCLFTVCALGHSYLILCSAWQTSPKYWFGMRALFIMHYFEIGIMVYNAHIL